MKYIILLVIGLVAGAAGAFFLDRTPSYRPTVDDVLSQLSSPIVKYGKVSDATFAETMEKYSIDPCFVRDPALKDEAPVWMTREPLGPNGLEREPEHPVPDLSELPGLVKIEQILSDSGSQKHHCAATRIGKNWFLTAAHCVRMKGSASSPVMDMVIVEPREDVAQEETIIVPIDGAVCHSAWYSQTGKFDDDIALVHVSDVSALNDVKIAVFDHASAPLPPEAYEDAQFAGWGKNGRNRFLQGGSLSIVEIGETFILGDNEGEFSPCVGDSGGPLYVDTISGKRVVGVLSSVSKDACPPYEWSFYTRVKTFQPWIDTAMNLCRQDGQFVCRDYRLN